MIKNNEVNFKNSIERKLLWLKRKYFFSKFIWVSLNLFQIIITAFITLLSAYAISKNTQGETVFIFIIISLISSITTFCVNLISIFNIGERIKKIKKNINVLSENKKAIRYMNNEEFQNFLIEVANSDLT